MKINHRLTVDTCLKFDRLFVLNWRGFKKSKATIPLGEEIEIVTGWELEDLSGRRSAKFSNFCWHDLPTDFALLNRFGKQKLNFQPSISTLTVQALYEALFFRDRIQKRAEP